MSKFRKGASSEEIRNQKEYDDGISGGEHYTNADQEIIEGYVEQVLAGKMHIEDLPVVPDEFRRPVKREVVLARAEFKIQNRQQDTNEGAKMSITRSTLRRLVNEELNKLREEEEPPAVKAVKDFYSKDSKDEAELESSYEKLAKELHAAGAKDLSSIEAAVEAADHDPSSIAQDLLRRVAKLNESRNLRRLILRELRQQGIC